MGKTKYGCLITFGLELLMLSTIGCMPFSDLVHSSDFNNVQLLQGIRDIHPEKRKLKVIGVVSPKTKDLLRQYVTTGKSKHYGYILSEFYLKNNDQIIGIVEKTDGTLLGLDVTLSDVSKLPVSTTHKLIVNENEISVLLLEAIKIDIQAAAGFKKTICE